MSNKRTVTEVTNAEYPSLKAHKHIIELPLDVIGIVASYLSSYDIYALMQTCKQIYDECQTYLIRHPTLSRMCSALDYANIDYILCSMDSYETNAHSEHSEVQFVYRLLKFHEFKTVDIIRFIDMLPNDMRIRIMGLIGGMTTCMIRRFELVVKYNLNISNTVIERVMTGQPQFDGYIAKLLLGDQERYEKIECLDWSAGRLNSLYANHGLFEKEVIARYKEQLRAAIRDCMLSQVDKLLRLKARTPEIKDYKINHVYDGVFDDKPLFWPVMELLHANGMFLMSDDKFEDMLEVRGQFIVLAIEYNFDQLMALGIDPAIKLLDEDEMGLIRKYLKKLMMNPKFNPHDWNVCAHIKKAIDFDAADILLSRSEYIDEVQAIFGVKIIKQ